MTEAPDQLGARGHLRHTLRFPSQIEMAHRLESVPALGPAPRRYLLPQFRRGDEDAYMALYSLAFDTPGVLERNLEQRPDHPFFVIEHIRTGTVATGAVPGLIPVPG